MPKKSLRAWMSHEAGGLAVVGDTPSCAIRIQMTSEEVLESGNSTASQDPADYARFLSTVISGLGVQGANGATRVEMKLVADFVLRAIRMA